MLEAASKNHPLNDDEFLRHHWIIYFGYQTRKTQGNKTIPFEEYLLKKFFIQQNINRKSAVDFNEVTDDEIAENDESYEQEAEEEYANEDTSNAVSKQSQVNLTLKVIQNYSGSLRELVPFWYQTY